VIDDATLLADDRRAREQALDAARSFIVQAPAGSGKTELLIQRYLRLLSTVENPEEILAITFTRKAAFEMQVRIINAMRDAKDGVDVREPHRQITRQEATGALERDAEKGWRLIESPQRLRIQTIDALNASIARSLPFSSGLGASVEVASDDAMQTLYSSAAAATLDWLVSTDDRNAAAVERLLLHLDNNTALYTGHIARMLETRDQWLTIIGVGREEFFDEVSLRTRLERNIAEQVSSQLGKVTRLIPGRVVAELLQLALYAAGRISADSSLALQLQSLGDCQSLPGCEPDSVDAWCGVAELLLTRAGAWRKSVNRNTGFPPGDRGEKRRMLDLLEELDAHAELAFELDSVRKLPPVRYSDEQWNVLIALFRLLPLAVAELRRLFAEQRIIDYIEVAMAAHAALGSIDDPGDIALLLDYSIAHLLIDEMQDTSIAQYELIEKLVGGWQAGDGRTLFCVGDPMQSVYRFRNAEVGEFLLAREKGVGQVKLESLVLRRNFRSGENLVHWFNSVFANVLPAADDVAEGAIAYAASVPVESQQDLGEIHIHPLFGGSNEEEAEYGVRVIQACLQLPGDLSTALLVRSRTQLPPLLARLRAAGIDYHAVDIDRLTDLPEIIEVLALARALCHRDDRLAWLALLRSPWAGLDWSDLHALVRNDASHSVRELMEDELRVADLSPDARSKLDTLRRGLAPFLNGHGATSLQERVEHAWFALGGPFVLQNADQVANVYRFFDVLHRMETCGTLADVTQLERRLDLERVATPTRPGARLQVMTMHKAKGLEFDQVILYGLGHRTHGDRKSVLSWLNVPDREGGKDFLISPLGARAELDADPLHNLIEWKLREKDRLEQDRLLYVACTRARRTLHLVGHVPMNADGDDFREPQSGSLLQRIWPAVRADYETAFKRAHGVTEARDRYASDLQMPALYRLREDAARPAVRTLPEAARSQLSPDTLAERHVEYYWVGSVARHAGSIVHRFLQRFTEGTLPADPDGQFPLEPIARRWACEMGVPAADIAAVCQRASSALERILGDEKGRWILFGPGRCELPLTGVWQGRIESIVLDRVRIDSDGVHWVIDYKTSTHEGGDLDRFLQQEVARYQPQLTRYSAMYRALADVPVRAALYFPLLQEFREVPVES
jgi:ATP-dependent exoDNAse (exonuclease V) beta subunit